MQFTGRLAPEQGIWDPLLRWENNGHIVRWDPERALWVSSAGIMTPDLVEAFGSVGRHPPPVCGQLSRQSGGRRWIRLDTTQEKNWLALKGTRERVQWRSPSVGNDVSWSGDRVIEPESTFHVIVLHTETLLRAGWLIPELFSSETAELSDDGYAYACRSGHVETHRYGVAVRAGGFTHTIPNISLDKAATYLYVFGIRPVKKSGRVRTQTAEGIPAVNTVNEPTKEDNMENSTEGEGGKTFLKDVSNKFGRATKLGIKLSAADEVNHAIDWGIDQALGESKPKVLEHPIGKIMVQTGPTAFLMFIAELLKDKIPKGEALAAGAEYMWAMRIVDDKDLAKEALIGLKPILDKLITLGETLMLEDHGNLDDVLAAQWAEAEKAYAEDRVPAGERGKRVKGG